MNIYNYAKEFDADYMDMSTGYIYKVQEYNQAKRLGLPTPGILVYDSEGNYVGIAGEI